MKYQLASRREEAVTVDGLGVLQPGETREITEQEAENFRISRGLSLVQAGLPEGVEVTIVVAAAALEVEGGPVVVKSATGEVVGNLESTTGGDN